MKDVPDSLRRIAVSIHAMGGQGGGVLAEWVAETARAAGWVAQMTSVPGVAQRTGATVYYIEMAPPRPDGRHPVLALMPMPGAVDVVIAAEFMEAGRAIQRGLVTPDRTLLIASTHRSLAVSEKEQPGDGTADAGKVQSAIAVTARQAVLDDFATLAERHRSQISATLFGALFGSGALPFLRPHFEAAIRGGGTGVEASLAAFGAAATAVMAAKPRQSAASTSRETALAPLPAAGATTGHAALDALVTRIRTEVPPAAHGMAFAGVRHLVDYQDPAYAGAYLDRLAGVAALDASTGGAGKGNVLTVEVARHLARAMAYDDVIRVADLKIRGARLARVAREVAVSDDDVLQTVEFFHPRMEEVCATLPMRLGAAIEKRPRLMHWLDRLVDRGRRIRTDTILGHLQLAIVASRRPHRRDTLRHGREMSHIDAWLSAVTALAARNYDAAVETARCRRLVKGYSDTIARGLSKYDRVLAGARLVEMRPDAADWIRRLRQAALLDEGGIALDGALKTIATLDAPAAPAVPAR